VIWLIGNRGMLGSDIEQVLIKSDIPYCASDAETDITDIDQLISFARGKDIKWIINASAYAAVDKAETEELLANRINSSGVCNIAQVADVSGAKLIHFSTDYVFEGAGDTPYKDTDLPHPISAYGRTKLNGEIELVKNTENYFIFRISWLYGVYGNNFVKTMLRLFNERDELGIVNDQIGAPTYSAKLAENILKLIEKESTEFGIYHYSDEGEISWYDFACEIKKLTEHNGLTINPIPTDAYPTPAKRPANSRMDKTKVKQLGFEVADWKENLKKYFDQMETL